MSDKIRFSIVGCGRIAQQNAQHINAYGQLVIACDLVPERADEVVREYNARSYHYPVALPNMVAYEYIGHSREDFPVASRYESRILSLPIFPEMKDKHVKVVVGQIRSFYA